MKVRKRSRITNVQCSSEPIHFSFSWKQHNQGIESTALRLETRCGTAYRFCQIQRCFLRQQFAHQSDQNPPPAGTDPALRNLPTTAANTDNDVVKTSNAPVFLSLKDVDLAAVRDIFGSFNAMRLNCALAF